MISSGDTTFVLLCTILVFLMIPGLGFFYAGLDRRRFALTIVMQCLVSIPVTTIIWIFGGFGLAFGPNIGGGFLGNPQYYFILGGVIANHAGQFIVNAHYAAHVPFIAFFAYQLMFAIITAPLMTGAFADRMTWGKYILFIILWQYLVYIPLCHWLWGGGFLAQKGALDWAGGIVIHTSAGFGALATVLVIGKRKPLQKNAAYNKSSSMWVMLGIALLWFGWFGFNSGGAMGINGEALRGFINTALAPCFAFLTWLFLEYAVNHRKMSATSVAGSFVAGLAGITPCAGFVPIWAGLPIGAIVALVSFGTLTLIHKAKHVDDAMDVFAVHGMTGFTGSILVGVFFLSATALTLGANPAVTYTSSAGVVPNIYHGYQFGIQIGAATLGATWSFAFTAAIAALVFYTAKKIPFAYKEYRSSFEEEQNDENPYDGDRYTVEITPVISQVAVMQE